MDQKDPNCVDDRRFLGREPLEEEVMIRFEQQDIIGPGQNISEDGVFFVAAAALRVRARLRGADPWREGEVVRVQSMGDGKIGFAVKFTDATGD